jgi:hypothetical protein
MGLLRRSKYPYIYAHNISFKIIPFDRDMLFPEFLDAFLDVIFRYLFQCSRLFLGAGESLSFQNTF